MPFSESLIYSKYANLNLTRIFMTSVFIGASGAMMDLTVGIIHTLVGTFGLVAAAPRTAVASGFFLHVHCCGIDIIVVSDYY